MRKLRQLKRRKGKMIHQTAISQKTGAKLGLAMPVQTTAQEISILEKLISRQADFNVNSNRVLERLTVVANRILGTIPESADENKEPGPSGGTIGDLEWRICQAEFICAAIAAQVSRLEIL
jgi:hypothetical protein